MKGEGFAFARWTFWVNLNIHSEPTKGWGCAGCRNLWQSMNLQKRRK